MCVENNEEEQDLEKMKSSYKINIIVQVSVSKILPKGGDIRNRSRRNYRHHTVLYSERTVNQLDVECNGLLAKVLSTVYLYKD